MKKSDSIANCTYELIYPSIYKSVWDPILRLLSYQRNYDAVNKLVHSRVQSLRPIKFSVGMSVDNSVKILNQQYDNNK